MKKIPTLFKREFVDHQIVNTLPEVTEGLDWVLAGQGRATVKYDGACTAIIDGEFYKRYDAKNGKPVPEGAIKCQEEPDPVTGHMPCWVKCRRDKPEDKWFWAAYDHAKELVSTIPDGTYEAMGKHFNNNPYNLEIDSLMPHGLVQIYDLDRTYEGIRNWLETHYEEGIVFWRDGEPKCKIKRSDFGFEWGNR